MKKRLRHFALFSALLLNTSLMLAQQLPYQNPNLSAEVRANDLISRLTLEEKTKLMMDTSPAIARLGIPQFQWWNEALHGVGRNGFVTVFPITMHMAASWDDALLYKVFTAVSDEARAKAQEAKKSGNIKRYQSLSFWTPNINIFRDPRWGRGQETYGEDPYLTTRMGLAVVNGLQGQTFDGKLMSAPGKLASSSSEASSSGKSPQYVKLLACAKHFAVHSGPEWNRHSFNIENLPARDLWETYLPAFKSLVQDGHVAEVMCAYQRIDGKPCCGNARYERQILRDEWGFKGLITSDCGAINDFYVPGRHETAKTPAEATAQALGAGTDVECGSVYRSLPEAVKTGLISEEKVNESLKRLLVARFRLGDFDKDENVAWTQIPSSVIASQPHKDLAEKMAEEGIVLLQNKNRLLPLNPKMKIVVMGPNANDSIMQWGNYSGYPTATTTILQGIRNYVEKAYGNHGSLAGTAPGCEVKYIPACTLTRNEVSESRFNLFSVSPELPEYDKNNNRTVSSGNAVKGMKAIYWNNPDMQGEPVAEAVMTTPINQSNGGNTVFAPGVNLTNFSARYMGVFTPDKDETLDIKMGCDDGYRLIIDGDTVANVWKGRARVQMLNKPIAVKAGKKMRIQVDYFQKTDMAVMQFDIVKNYTPTEAQLLAEVGDADAVVFVGGISPSLEGEEMKVSEPGFKGGDRTDIELPQAQRQVIEMLHRAGKRVVFVNCSGSAIAMAPETENAEAILQAWYPGERGGEAVAKVLFGEVNPSGKLPITFYKSTADLPDFLDYTMKNRTYRYFKGEALFPFGHGLSYTTFEYGKLTLRKVKSEERGVKNSNASLKGKFAPDSYLLEFPIYNKGTREGTEVAQVYVKRIDDVDGPIKSLKAFQRVTLKAGEKQTVSIDLPRKSFEGWDAQTNTMRVVSGKYQVFVGGSSEDAARNMIEVKVK